MSVKLKRESSARFNQANQQIHYLHRRFNWNDIDQTATQPGQFFLGVLPAECVPLETYVRVNTAFTSGDIMVGTSAAGSSGVVVSTQDVASGTTGLYVVDRYMGTYSTSQERLFIQTATSGAGAGQADVWQAYLPMVTTNL